MQKKTNNSQNQPPALTTITLHAVAEPTRKRRGEAAEAAFLARATHLGFTVCLPWGDSNRYDSVVELNRGFLRVQVKSATRYAENRYRVKTTGANGRVYTSKEIDFFVAYIVPENIWYILPIQSIGQRKGIRFYPHTRRQSRALFEKYRETWCLLDSCLSVRLRRGLPNAAAARIWKSAAPSAPNAANCNAARTCPERQSKGPSPANAGNRNRGVARELVL